MKDESKNKKQLISELEELRQKVCELSSITRNIGHEIRTPLNSIIGFSGMLYKNETSEEKKEFLYHIITSGRVLLSIMSKLDPSLSDGGAAKEENSIPENPPATDQPQNPIPEVVTGGGQAAPDESRTQINTPESHVSAINATEKLSILLAEDNVSNAKLMSRLLKQYGHDVVCVENGRQAVDAVNRFEFDALIMDIQMPVMNGKEASVAIRKAGFVNVPIIALTACASAAEREECMNAGMDAFISKPINIDDIENNIHKIIEAKKNAVPGNTFSDFTKGTDMPENSPQIKTAKNFDREKLDEIMGGIEEIMQEAIDLFIDSATDNISEIQKAINSNDAQQVKKFAHKLKGSALNACAMKTIEVLTGLEKASDENDFVKIKDLFESLNDSIDSYEQEVKKQGLYNKFI